MRVAFVQRDVYDYIGLMQLIAVLEAMGHAASLVVGFSDKAILRALHADPPDLLALNVTAGVSWRDGLRTASQFKRRHPEVPVVLGGSYVTLYPELFESAAAEYACVGEGEGALAELVDALQDGRDPADIQNLRRKLSGGRIEKNPLRPLVEDLDSLPTPERRHHYAYPFLRAQKRKNFIASRGCAFSCAYCYIASMRAIYNGIGTFVRWRSPENLVAEIARVKKDYGMACVGFMDDLFPYDKKWVSDFTHLYQRDVRLPFMAAARTELLDEELIRMLAAAGCRSLGIGIETSSEKLRESILERPSEHNEEIVAKLLAVRSAGIRLLTFNMMGIPGETERDAWQTVAMNARVRAEYPRFTVLTPSPGLRIADTAVRMRDCTEEEVRATGTYLRRSVFKGASMRRIERIQKVATLAARHPRLNFLWKFLARTAPASLLDVLFMLSNGVLFLRINFWSVPYAMRYGFTVARWYK